MTRDEFQAFEESLWNDVRLKLRMKVAHDRAQFPASPPIITEDGYAD